MMDISTMDISMQSDAQSLTDYARIERAIHYIEENARQQPDLATVAAHVGLSEYHFQRLFTRWAGTTPKRFLQYLTLQHAKALLDESTTVLDATFETGLSSPGRLHDLFVTLEAITPGEYKSKGEGLTIYYGFHATPFGEVLLALTERGISGLSFVPAGGRDEALRDLAEQWPLSSLMLDDERTAPYIERIFNQAADGDLMQPLPLFVKGTNFQVQVWQALLRIPAGMVVSYDTIARFVCSSRASRAVGAAVGKNPVGYLIPCHRVIHKAGNIGNYHWGSARKKAILAWEAAQRN
jgi:AraC family transcriptional regulator of adaptative response/methylated-DNA-[protein]-cysteine methyltransferase